MLTWVLESGRNLNSHTRPRAPGYQSYRIYTFILLSWSNMEQCRKSVNSCRPLRKIPKKRESKLCTWQWIQGHLSVNWISSLNRIALKAVSKGIGRESLLSCGNKKSPRRISKSYLLFRACYNEGANHHHWLTFWNLRQACCFIVGKTEGFRYHLTGGHRPGDTGGDTGV